MSEQHTLVDIHVLDDQCRVERYVTDRRTSIRAVPVLRDLVDQLDVNLA